eukprot:scaffold15954_cov62-Phaeocystis_antarctica.AAC.3
MAKGVGGLQMVLVVVACAFGCPSQPPGVSTPGHMAAVRLRSSSLVGMVRGSLAEGEVTPNRTSDRAWPYSCPGIKASVTAATASRQGVRTAPGATAATTRVRAVVERERAAVRALGRVSCHEDERHVGLCGERCGSCRVGAVVIGDSAAATADGGCDGVIGCGGVVGYHAARAATMHRRLLGLLAYDRNDDGARGEAACQCVVLRGGHVVGLGVLVGRVEETHSEHRREDAPCRVVNLGQADVACMHGRRQPRPHPAGTGHLLIESSVDRCRVCGAPVRHDPPLEAQPLLKVALQRLGVFARPDAPDPVVRAHDRADARLDCRFEGRIVEFELRAFVDHLAHARSRGLLVVVHPVLGVGDDPLRLVRVRVRVRVRAGVKAKFMVRTRARIP